MPETTTSIDLADIQAAAKRIATYAHRTPVLTCSSIDERCGCEVFFKCENFQKVGAFKFRGACNAVSKLSDEQAVRGVVTHSSGNHAQALALAAKLRGIDAHIVMPRNAPQVKRAAVEGYEARVYPCEPTLDAREQSAKRVVEQTQATFIPPYNHPDIIAGQGTAGLELIQQVDDLDAIIAPIGGGGLVSGTCIAARSSDSTVRVFAAEPTGADDAARSKAAGRLIKQESPRTIADGLLTSLGDLTWPIVRDMVTEIVTVDDAAIITAMRFVWERMKIIIEPSGAVAVAAVLADGFARRHNLARIGCVLSGGNVDLDRLGWQTSRAG